MFETIHGWFGQKTFERARDYVQRSRVQSYHYDENHKVLSGMVMGNRLTPYSAEIDFVFTDFSRTPVIIGECSCPVGAGCKHICALMLTAAMEVGEDTLESWVSHSPTYQPHRPLPKGGMSSEECSEEWQDTLRRVERVLGKLPNTFKSVFQENLLESAQDKPETCFANDKQEFLYNRWLKNLQKAAADVQVASETAPLKTARQQKRYVLYLLTLDHTRLKVKLSLETSQQLKRGGHGAPRPINDLSRMSWDNSPPFSPEDKRLIQKLYGAGILDPFGGYNHYDGGPKLEDKSPEPLFDLARSGRLAWGQDTRTPVTVSEEPIEIQLNWIEKGGSIASVIHDPQGRPAPLLFTTPLTVLVPGERDEDKSSYRNMVLAPVKSDIPDALLKQIFLSPSIPKEIIPQLRETLAPMPGIKPEFLPEVVENRIVEPKPILVLDGIPASKGQPVTLAARARIYFQYGPHRVNWQEPLEILIGDDNVRYPRNKGRERKRMLEALSSLHPASQWRSEAAYEGGDYCGGSLSHIHTDAKWLTLMNITLPALEKLEWHIEVVSSFPYDVLDINDDDWYGEVSESEAQEDWFDLKMGIEINGEKLDLLPLIAKQLNRLPDTKELASMGDEPVSVALGGQRFIAVPAKRLRMIIVTLLELFSDRGTGIYKSQAPVLEELGQNLGLDFAGGETLQAIARKLKNFRKLKTVKPSKHFQGELRDYQEKGVAWLQFLREMGLAGILADDMGLGKTVQALAHIQLEKERLNKGLKKSKASVMAPCLVVAPTSLMHNWRREAERFAPTLKVIVYHGSRRHEQREGIAGADLVLTTYALVQRDYEHIKEQNWHLLILDESQAIKNPRAKASLFVRWLKAEHRLCMTGTPVENNLAELWSQFDFLMPGFLGAKDRFTRIYRTPIERNGDNEQRKQLARRVAPFMLRRTKEVVAKELPPKTEILRECELKGKQRDLYETVRAAMEKKVRDEISKKGLARSQIIILDALLKMRQTCCDPQLVKLSQAKKVKESAKMELLGQLLDELLAEGRKILIFSQFTSMLALIEAELVKRKVLFVKLTGSTTDRDTPVQTFQSGQVPVFLISLKAGGAGLNLTAADTVIHYDPWWNPAVEDQATDRAYRIGQDKPVFVYKLVATGTLEEKMLHLKERKKALAEGVYSGGGKKATGITAKDLDVLFEPLAAE